MEKIEDALKYIKLYTNCDNHALNRIRHILESMVVTKEIPVVKEKIVYVHKKRSSVALDEWATNWLHENNVTYKQLAKHDRSRGAVTIRNKFCVDAYINGYGASQIGRYLKRDHTTILHCIHKIKRISK